jgi:tetratricopeptide (TPR) repeat protein
MIVKDGSGSLARCLGSVAGLVDDVIVVDTGSSDASMAVAARLGARVVAFPWSDSFAEARNESLRLAEGEWAFWLDADEWLDAEARAAFRALTERLEGSRCVYFMQQLSDLGGPGGGSVSVSQARLFRNGPEARWRYRVHEQILPACVERGDAPCPTDVVVRHSGYESPELIRLKNERNLRLLEREREENPDDPWVLLQLGRLLRERFDAAEPPLRRALNLLPPGDPLSHQIYPLLVQGYRAQGRPAEARQLLREGLSHSPNDTGLLMEAGVLAFQGGRLDEAEAAFSALLGSPPDPDEFLGSVDLSLRGWRTRHNLAVVYQRQGRQVEAELLWRAAAAEKPDAAQVWRGLVELYLSQSRWDDLAPAIDQLERHAPGSTEVSPDDAPLFRACAHLTRGEFAEGRALLRGLIARNPRAVWPRVLLSRSYLLAGDDPSAAEQALRDVLAVDPENAEARKNLDELTRRVGADVA